jgi:predicted AAA+ superfamily ATPase
MLKRELNISKLRGSKSSAFLFGARGVGKTHLAAAWIAALKKSGAAVQEINLLHTDTFERYLKHPALFREELELHLKRGAALTVFVDEIQKLPALLDEVHALLETHKSKVRFLLTGSSARKLKRDRANLLAGRALTLRLHPLTCREVELPLKTLLRLGSLPGMVVDNESPEMSLRSYVSTYLREEIQQEAQVRRLDAFARFLEIAAQYHGKIVNASEIAKAAGVSSNTIATYFDILQDTLLGWMIPGWNASVKKQLRTTPKFYLFDNGVANALRGELGIEMRESSSRFGDLFEAMVIQEMRRLNDYLAMDLKFSYWRTNAGLEVDIIISRGMGRPLAAIEIKSASAPDSTDVSALRSFHDEYPGVPRFCYCRTPRAFKRDGIHFMPWQEGLALLPTF